MTDHTPQRIRLSRAKGWKMPPNTVKVARGTKWGNPHKVDVSLADNGDGTWRYMDAADAVAAYETTVRYWIDPTRGEWRLPIEQLRGKNLACWCPLDQPCHADILLKLANE